MRPLRTNQVKYAPGIMLTRAASNTIMFEPCSANVYRLEGVVAAIKDYY